LQVHLLREAAGQVEHLRWKSEAFPVTIKGGQERIILARLKDQPSHAFVFQDAAKGCFSHPNQAFDGHELRQPEPRFIPDIGPDVLMPEKTDVVAGLKPKKRVVRPPMTPGR